MNNAMQGKNMKNVRNRIDERLVNYEKDCLNIKTKLYVTQNI